MMKSNNSSFVAFPFYDGSSSSSSFSSHRGCRRLRRASPLSSKSSASFFWFLIFLLSLPNFSLIPFSSLTSSSTSSFPNQSTMATMATKASGGISSDNRIGRSDVIKSDNSKNNNYYYRDDIITIVFMNYNNGFVSLSSNNNNEGDGALSKEQRQRSFCGTSCLKQQLIQEENYVVEDSSNTTHTTTLTTSSSSSSSSALLFSEIISPSSSTTTSTSNNLAVVSSKTTNTSTSSNNNNNKMVNSIIYQKDEDRREQFLTQIDIIDYVDNTDSTTTTTTTTNNLNNLMMNNPNPNENYCRSNNWKKIQYPNCNLIYELDILDRVPSEAIFQQQRSYNISSQLQPPPSSSSYHFTTTTTSYDILKLGSGHYRDVWLIKTALPLVDDDPAGGDRFVLRRLRFQDEFYDDKSQQFVEQIHSIQKEALIMERLSSSPRIMNIYGYCSTTILNEGMKWEVRPIILPPLTKQSSKSLSKNSLTSIQKLDISIQMAESIADMHGYKDGIIVHGDIHPKQWFAAKTASSAKSNNNNNNNNNQIRLVLNDFNLAEILDFNDNDSTYCKAYRQFGGMYRAPEEYGGYIDEAIDTYAMGNNIYCLLTGQIPYYELYDELRQNITKRREIQSLVRTNQIRPYIDPIFRHLSGFETNNNNTSINTFIERQLVEIMEKAWEFDPGKRLSIFDVVALLKETKKESYNRFIK